MFRLVVKLSKDSTIASSFVCDVSFLVHFFAFIRNHESFKQRQRMG